MNQVNPSQWMGILETAAQSRGITSKGQDRQYIAAAVNAQGREYTLIDQAKISPQSPKLSLLQIVQVSKKKFEELQQSFEQGKVNETTFIDLTEKISKYTEQLIEGRETKRDQVKWKFARGVSRVLAFVTSFIGVGFLLNSYLNKMDKDFKKEMTELKETIRQPTQDAINKLEAKQAKIAIQKQIQDQLNRIPRIIEELNTGVSDKDRLELIQKRIIEDAPTEANQARVHQFEKDMKRGNAFLRKDVVLGIEDKTPEPSYHLKGEERVEAGVKALQDLFQNDQDQRWEMALQLVTNQTTLNNIFDAAITVFSMNSTVENDVRWTNPENGKEYALRAQFSNKLPPVHLEIIRNSVTQEIDKVQVEVKGFLDIASFTTSEGVDTKVIASEAIKGELKYIITLDSEKRPLISNLHSSLTTAPALATDKEAIQNKDLSSTAPAA